MGRSTPTPALPCRIERGHEGYRIIDAEGRMWADGFGEREAPFALAAFNAFEPMREALKEYLLDHHLKSPQCACVLCARGHVALKMARGSE